MRQQSSCVVALQVTTLLLLPNAVPLRNLCVALSVLAQLRVTAYSADGRYTLELQAEARRYHAQVGTLGQPLQAPQVLALLALLNCEAYVLYDASRVALHLRPSDRVARCVILKALSDDHVCPVLDSEGRGGCARDRAVALRGVCERGFRVVSLGDWTGPPVRGGIMIQNSCACSPGMASG